VILMVARELAAEVPTMLAAGAASVLFKDAFSKNSLIETIAGLLETSTAKADRVPNTPPPAFGQFSFIARGQMHTLFIPHFQFLSTLGSSPLAQVFSAERIEDRKRVVIKIQLTNPHHGAEARAFGERYRFINEQNGHHVVRYLDAGVADSWPYVVLEYLAGGDLRRRIAARAVVGTSSANGPSVDPETAVYLLGELCRAMATFHAGSFAHMDLKPENIFFRGEEIVLIDFNISTRFGSVARNRATGDVLGSPFYMSPEQGQGLAVDARSDLYSAGVIFYEMLTGSLPYIGESAAQIIYKHLHDEIPLLPSRVRAYQPIVDALMAKNRDERVASTGELTILLAPFLGRADRLAPIADSQPK
jgi:serine/threonine-protein kinase PpkA